MDQALGEIDQRMAFASPLRSGVPTIAAKSRTGQKPTRENRPQPSHATSKDPAFTPAEHGVACALAQGYRNEEIAKLLHLSVRTVEAHLTHMYRKFAVHGRTALLAHLFVRSEPSSTTVRETQSMFSENHEHGEAICSRLPRVQYRMLGSLETDGATISSPQARRLLAILLSHRNRIVSLDTIIATLWDDDPPPAAKNAVFSKLSRLKANLPNGALLRIGDGYQLHVPVGSCDADAFDELVHDAHHAPVQTRGALCHAALALVRGPTLGDLAYVETLRPVAAHYDRRREEVEELYLDSLLELRDHHHVLRRTDAILADWPFREQVVARRLMALAQLGRRVEALRELHDFRVRLAEETGLGPSTNITDVEALLLREGSVFNRPQESGPPAEPALFQPHGLASSLPTSVIIEQGPRTPANPSTTWRGPLASNTPLVGRDDELDLIIGAFDDAGTGGARTIVLTGPPGIGKSRLLKEGLFRATQQRALVLKARAVEGLTTPFFALRTALGTVGIDPTNPQSQPGELNHNLWAEQAHDIANRLVGHASDPNNDQVVVIALEDAHWADPASLLVLEHAMTLAADTSELRPCRLLILVTTRPIPVDDRRRVSIARLTRNEGGTDILLRPLEESAAAELVESIAHKRPTATLIGALVSFGGSPLLITTALRALWNEGKLTLIDGLLSSSGSPGSIVTGDVAYGVAAMMHGMGEGIADALRVIALLGERTPISLIVQATGWDEAVIGEVGAAAHLRCLADIENEQFVYNHDLYRWALVEQFDVTARARRHRDIAERLTHFDHHNSLEHTILIARHMAAAGSHAEQAKAVAAFTDAGNLCFNAGLWAEAAVHLHAALAITDPAFLLLPVSRTGDQRKANLHDQSANDFTQYLDTPDTDTRSSAPPGQTERDVVALALHLGITHQRNHDAPAASLVLRQVVRYARQLDLPDIWGEAALSLQRARFSLSALDLDKDTQELEVFLASTNNPENVESSGIPNAFENKAAPATSKRISEIRAEGYGLLAERAIVTGEIDQGLVLIEHAIREVHNRAVSPVVKTRVYTSQGLLFQSALNLPASLQSFRVALDGNNIDPWEEATTRTRLALSLYMLGELTEAYNETTRSLDLARSIGKWSEQSVCEALLASIALARHRPDRAEDHARRSIALLARSDYIFSGPIAYGALVCAAYQNGNHRVAQNALDQWPERQRQRLDSYRSLLGVEPELPPALRKVPRRVTIATAPTILAAAAEALRTGDLTLAQNVTAGVSVLNDHNLAWSLGWPFQPKELLHNLNQLTQSAHSQQRTHQT
jgi:DNA-binding SARP family transcriptional activator/DNA-binding CsgD family transcriptional regulator